MNRNKKFLIAAGIFAASLSQTQSATAHLEPEPGDGTETCYGVVKAGQNDCSTGKHSCDGKGTIDKAPDEWVRVPEGLCNKLVGGSLTEHKKE